MKISLIFLFAFCPLLLKSQSPTEKIEDDETTKNFFSIQLTPYLSSKIKFDHKGAALVESKHLISGEIGVGYYRQINSDWSMQSSINFGTIPFNFNYEFDAPIGSVFQTEPWKEYYQKLDFNRSAYDVFQSYANIDLLFSRKLYEFKNGNELNLGLGARVFRFFIDYSQQEYGDAYGVSEKDQVLRLFDSDINDTITDRYKGAILFETSFTKTLKHNQKIKASIFFNYSPYTNIDGYYYFSNLGLLSTGTFSQKLSFLGFRFSYLMSGQR